MKKWCRSFWVAAVVAVMVCTAACGNVLEPPETTESYFKTFDVPTEAITCMVGDTVVVPEVKAVTKTDEEITAAIAVQDPDGTAVALDSRRFKAEKAGTYKITYTAAYGETGKEEKTREIVAAPRPATPLVLINDFETAADKAIDPDGASVIWRGDNAQEFSDFTLNTDPQYVYNGEGSLKIAMSPKAGNYWPGLKFLSSAATTVNDFSDYYSVSMMLFNDSAQTVWLKLGNPGKDVKLESGTWTKAEILIAEMQQNGMAKDNLLNADGSFYFWFTLETGFSPVDLYVDAVYAQPAIDTVIDYDTPSGYVTVDSFTVEADSSKNQNESYQIVAPSYTLSAGEGEVTYRVVDPDGAEVKKENGTPLAAGDAFVLEKAGKYKVINTLTFDSGRTRVKTTTVTSKVVVTEPKEDVVYADFNSGLLPNLEGMGAVWATEDAVITHYTGVEYAKDGGSAKFEYTVAAGQWPSFRFSNGKFPDLNDSVMAGIKHITMQIYNAGDFDVTVSFNTVAFQLIAGQWNEIDISESEMADAAVGNAFHFFLTSNNYTAGQSIVLYVDNVILGFNEKLQ